MHDQEIAVDHFSGLLDYSFPRSLSSSRPEAGPVGYSRNDDGGALVTTGLNTAFRLVFRTPVDLYRWRCNRLLGRRFLLLIHVGRRSRRRRETVLEVMEYREAGPEVVVMSAFGPTAEWLRNIEGTPSPEVIIGRQRFVAAYRILDVEEAISVVEHYEQRNWFLAPIIRLVLSSLLGWPYRGSESDRRRLAAQLPLIALRPRS